MAATTVEKHVEELLSRQVVEQRTRGVPAPDVEAITLFETIAIALLLNPRAVLYAAFLARNALLVVAQRELSAIAELQAVIKDLGNVSLAVTDLTSLEKAQTALLQMEVQGHVSSESSSFTRFHNAVDTFINGQIAKNVRAPGSTTLSRPSAEAAADLPDVYQSLKTTHAELVERLYSLAVGVENFEATPLSAVLGLGASTRARQDIQDIVDNLSADPGALQSRDAVTKLIANRAVLRLLGSRPYLSEPLVSTSHSLPAGYDVKGASNDASPEVNTYPGPWVMPTNAVLTVQVGDDVATALFPQTDVDQQNAAVLIGSEVTFPLVINPGDALFVRIAAHPSWSASFALQADGTYESSNGDLGSLWSLENDGYYHKTFRADLNLSASPVSMTVADVLLALDSELDPLIAAHEHIRPGTGRIYLRSNPALVRSLSIAALQIVPSASTVGTPSVYTQSAAEKLGFYIGMLDIQGYTSRIQAEEAFNLIFAGIATMSRNVDGTMTIEALDGSPSAMLSISGSAASALGVQGNFFATTKSIKLFGKVLGEEQDPINPIPLVDFGDIVHTPTGTAHVVGLTQNSISLSFPVASFSGNVEITSGLYDAWVDLNTAVQALVDDWSSGPFATSLDRVDGPIAALVGSPTPAQRNNATAALEKLKTEVQALVDALSSAQIPTGAGTSEKRTIDNIVQSLVERKFDRAVDLLLRLRVQELFSLDWQTASYGGSILKASSDIARTDLLFPNRALEEGARVDALDDRREFPP